MTMTDLDVVLAWLLKLSALLAVVGAINWGLVAWFDMNMVTIFLGDDTLATKAVYTLIGLGGLSALYEILLG